MAEQIGKENTGGTMRLGDYTCVLERGTMAAKIYGQAKIVERHRHRYECNNDYRDQYETWGLKISGLSPDGNLVWAAGKGLISTSPAAYRYFVDLPLEVAPNMSPYDRG